MDLRDQLTIVMAGMSAAAFILVQEPSLKMVILILLAGLLALLLAKHIREWLRL